MAKISGKLALASLVLLAALLTLSTNYRGGLVPPVEAQMACGPATLHGGWGVSFHLLNTDPNTVPATIGTGTHTPGAGIGRVVFDGRGNLTGQETISFGGLILRPAVWGTYTVNADCTGSISMNIADAGTFPFDFVLVDAGRELRMLSTNQGDVAFNVWKRQ